MTRRHSYASPEAFRRALTDKLKTMTKSSRWNLGQLLRQLAYDRLLERLYLVDEGWVVKGAAALLARDIGVRATIDLDLFRKAARDVAERDLREAAGRDIGDWFTLQAGPNQPVVGGVRIPITAQIGTIEWAAFHVDLLGEELVMTGEPERVPALVRVVMPDVEQHGYRVYPLVDHVADKVAATVQRYGERELPSTRYKDLVDLVAIVSEASVDATVQMAALASESERRKITLPQQFSVPDRELWERGYAAEARRSLLETALTLDDALAVVKPFLDQLLDGSAKGTWAPERAAWDA